MPHARLAALLPAPPRGTRLAFALIFCHGMLAYLSFFFLPIYFKTHLGLSGREIGIFAAVNNIAAMLFIFPAGLGADAFSPRRMAQVFSLASALCFLLLPALAAFWSLLCVAALWSVSRQSVQLAINSEVFKKSEASQAGRVFGAYNFHGCMGVGAGMLLGAVLIDRLPFAVVFYVQAAGLLVMAGLSSLLPRTKTVRVELLRHARDFRRPAVLFFVLVLCLFSLHWGAEHTAYTLFLREVLGLTGLRMGLYMVCGLIAMASSAFVFGLLLQGSRVRAQHVFFIGIALSGLGHMLMTSTNPWFSVAMRMLHELGDGAMVVVMYFGIKKMFHVDHIGGSSGLVGLANLVGGFLGSLAFGAVLQAWGPQMPMIISGAITLLLIPLVLAGRRFLAQ